MALLTAIVVVVNVAAYLILALHVAIVIAEGRRDRKRQLRSKPAVRHGDAEAKNPTSDGGFHETEDDDQRDHPK